MAEKSLTQTQIDRLDDAAFLVVNPGGARDSQGKTAPRRLRVGPHHNPSQREFQAETRAGRRGSNVPFGQKIGRRPRLKTAHAARSTGELNEVEVRKVIAELNAGSLPVTPQERQTGWLHMAQHAAELGFKMPPKRF